MKKSSKIVLYNLLLLPLWVWILVVCWNSLMPHFHIALINYGQAWQILIIASILFNPMYGSYLNAIIDKLYNEES